MFCLIIDIWESVSFTNGLLCVLLNSKFDLLCCNANNSENAVLNPGSFCSARIAGDMLVLSAELAVK